MLTNTHQHGRYKAVRFNSSSFCRTEVSMMEQAISLFENIFGIVFQRSSMWPLVSPGKKILSRQWQHSSPLSESCSRGHDITLYSGQEKSPGRHMCLSGVKGKAQVWLIYPSVSPVPTNSDSQKTFKDKCLEHS